MGVLRSREGQGGVGQIPTAARHNSATRHHMSTCQGLAGSLKAAACSQYNHGSKQGPHHHPACLPAQQQQHQPGLGGGPSKRGSAQQAITGARHIIWEQGKLQQRPENEMQLIVQDQHPAGRLQAPAAVTAAAAQAPQGTCARERANTLSMQPCS